MRVLGVDPGTMVTGWGVVDCEGPRLVYVDSGVIRAGRGDIAARLAHIYSELAALIELHRPEEFSLERNFLARNVQSAFRLGEARGVAMAAAAAAKLRLSEYAPNTVKKAVVGYGHADKAQVQAAVGRLFSLGRVPAEDEADALAAAVCHGMTRGFDAKVKAVLAASTRRRKAAAGR